MKRARPFGRERYSYLSITATSNQEGSLVKRFRERCKREGLSVKVALLQLVARFLNE